MNGVLHAHRLFTSSDSRSSQRAGTAISKTKNGKTENDPPVGAHGDGPKAFAFTLQRMQPEGWLVHVLDPARRIERSQDQAYARGLICLYFAAVVIRKEKGEMTMTPFNC